jgi:GTPase SAR1 family protein
LNENYVPLRFHNNNVSIELKNLLIKSRVLIVGDAGCGKTTICQYITYSWTIGKLWRNQVDWLFYIKMRNLNSQFYPEPSEQYSLIDIIKKECFQNCKFDDLDKQKLTNLLQNPSKILWILDGCDERTVRKYLPAIEQELLLKSHLLLTSRPHETHDFEYDVQIQIQSFRDEDIEKYISKYFSLTLRSTGNACWSFIRYSEQLLHTARIPACLEIICSLWESGKVRFDTGMTIGQLYQKMCEYLLRRYLLKFHSRCYSALVGRDIYQEPNAVAFAHLEYLAFKAIESHKLTISKQKKVMSQILYFFPYCELVYLYLKQQLFPLKSSKTLTALFIVLFKNIFVLGI